MCSRPHSDLLVVQKSGSQSTGSSRSTLTPLKPEPLPPSAVTSRPLSPPTSQTNIGLRVHSTEKPNPGGLYLLQGSGQHTALRLSFPYTPALVQRRFMRFQGRSKRRFFSDANLHAVRHTEGELKPVTLGYRLTQETKLAFMHVFLADILPQWHKPKQKQKRLCSSGLHASTKVCIQLQTPGSQRSGSHTLIIHIYIA